MKGVFAVVGVFLFVATLAGYGVLAWHHLWTPLLVSVVGGSMITLVFAAIEFSISPLLIGGTALLKRAQSVLALPLMLIAAATLQAAFAVWCVGIMWYFTNIYGNVGWLALVVGVSTANAPFAWASARSRIPEGEYDSNAVLSIASLVGTLICAAMLYFGFSYLNSAIPIFLMFVMALIVSMFHIFTTVRPSLQLEYAVERRIREESDKDGKKIWSPSISGGKTIADVLRHQAPQIPVSKGNCTEDDPLIVVTTKDYVDVEYAVAINLLESEGLEFRLANQAFREQGNRALDVLTFDVKRKGARDWSDLRTFYFDITVGYNALNRILGEIQDNSTSIASSRDVQRPIRSSAGPEVNSEDQKVLAIEDVKVALNKNGEIKCTRCSESVRPLNSVLTDRESRTAKCPFCGHSFLYALHTG